MSDIKVSSLDSIDDCIDIRSCCFGSDSTLLITLTDFCNQKCLHCMRDAKVGHPSVLPIEVFSKHIETSRSTFYFDKIIFSGGEPTLVKNIIELVTVASSFSSHVGICTNAVAISNPKASELARSGLTHATVGIEGVGERYEYFRQAPGSFSSMLRGVKALKANGIYVTINITMWNGILDSAQDITAVFDHHGVDAYSVSSPILNGRAGERADLFSEITKKNTLEFARNLQLKTPQKIHVRLPDCEARVCASGRGIRQLSPNGTLGHCPDFGARTAPIGE